MLVRTPRGDGPTIGPIAKRWMESNLVFGPGDRLGEPYEVDPYFAEFLDELYRVNEDGGRIVRRAVLSVGKGGAKSEFEAAVDLFELAGPCVVDRATGRAVPRRSPDIPVAAASFDQAKLVFGAAMKMAEKLAPELNIYEKEIERLDGSGKMYRVYSAAATNDGLRPTSVSIDELHEWVGGNKERLYLILTNGLSKRADSFEMTVTTAGDPGASSLLFNLYEYGAKVAAGEIVDPSFLMHWYEGGADVDLNDHDELVAAIAEANPATWVDPERIAQRWEVDRIKEHEFRRYHLNQWITGTTTWFNVGEWDACAAEVDVPAGARIVLSFDGSYNGDSTVLLGTTVPAKTDDDSDSDREFPHTFVVGAWERPDNASEWKVDREAVDAAVDDAFRKWDVAELACDPARWSLYMNAWAERYGVDRVLEFPQRRSSMVPATSQMYDAVTHRLMTHDGSAMMARHVGNATVKAIPDGRYVLTKDHPDRKIDGAIAAVIGHNRAEWRRDNDDENDDYVSITLI